MKHRKNVPSQEKKGRNKGRQRYEQQVKIHTGGKREGKTEKKQRDMAVTNIKNSKVQGLEWIFFFFYLHDKY